MKNYGLKLGAVSPTDYFVGKLPEVIIQPNGDYLDHLPLYEPQMLEDGTDENGCHIWGLLNALEIYMQTAFSGDQNFSERFVYNGMNYEPTGGDPFQDGLWVNNNGIVDESVLPMTKTYPEFIVPRPLTDELKQKGKEFLEKYTVKQEYLWNDLREDTDPEYKRKRITKYLPMSPLGISLYAWVRDENGNYYRPQNAYDTHYCVFIKEKEDSYDVFDSYDQSVKKVRKDMIDNSSICIRYYVEKKTQIVPPISKTWWQKVIEWLLSKFK
jgi:hypothetical protein